MAHSEVIVGYTELCYWLYGTVLLAIRNYVIGYTELCYWHRSAETEENCEKRQ